MIYSSGGFFVCGQLSGDSPFDLENYSDSRFLLFIAQFTYLNGFGRVERPLGGIMTFNIRKVVVSVSFWLAVFAAIIAFNTYWALTH